MARAASRKGDNAPRRIILKREEVVGGGHHGGSWKIAYADFVTAMMAFFLVMWLINATTEKQRRGIAQFFNPLAVDTAQPLDSVIATHPNVLAQGKVIPLRRGAQGIANPRRVSAASDIDAGHGKSSHAAAPGAKLKAPPARHQPSANPSGPQAEKVPPYPSEADKAHVVAIRQKLRNALIARQETAEMLGQVRVDDTSDEIRISIEDTEKKSMFGRGSAAPNAHAVALLKAIAPVLVSMPGQLLISGYTDASPYQGARKNNWVLSAMRADGARAVLEAAGFPASRLLGVRGNADHDPADPAHPQAPVNRRIVLVLQRDAAISVQK